MDKKNKLWYLENFNILENLSKEEMELLDKMASMQEASKNEVIYLSEDPSHKIYFY